LFGVAARGDAGVGDDFLEAVEHGSIQLYVFSYKFQVKQNLTLAAAGSTNFRTACFLLPT
jgi:hypothetical protein